MIDAPSLWVSSSLRLVATWLRVLWPRGRALVAWLALGFQRPVQYVVLRRAPACVFACVLVVEHGCSALSWFLVDHGFSALACVLVDQQLPSHLLSL